MPAHGRREPQTQRLVIMKLEAAAAEQMLLSVLPRRGAKGTGERGSPQLLTAMGSRALGSPRRRVSFQL